MQHDVNSVHLILVLIHIRQINVHWSLDDQEYMGTFSLPMGWVAGNINRKFFKPWIDNFHTVVNLFPLQKSELIMKSCRIKG